MKKKKLYRVRVTLDFDVVAYTDVDAMSCAVRHAGQFGGLPTAEVEPWKYEHEHPSVKKLVANNVDDLLRVRKHLEDEVATLKQREALRVQNTRCPFTLDMFTCVTDSEKA